MKLTSEGNLITQMKKGKIKINFIFTSPTTSEILRKRNHQKISRYITEFDISRTPS